MRPLILFIFSVGNFSSPSIKKITTEYIVKLLFIFLWSFSLLHVCQYRLMEEKFLALFKFKFSSAAFHFVLNIWVWRSSRINKINFLQEIIIYFTVIGLPFHLLNKCKYTSFICYSYILEVWLGLSHILQILSFHLFYLNISQLTWE